MSARPFRDLHELREWFERHHATSSELLLLFYKVDSGKPSVTWPQAVDEALCFGWIDGVRARVDDERYTIRFTPRRPRSTWSAVNVKRAEALRRAGRMKQPGLAAFLVRNKENTGAYSHEQKEIDLANADKKAFKANAEAWGFFSKQPPSYRKAATWWVVSAKRPETRARRLADLIDHSEDGLRLPQFTPGGKKAARDE